MRRHADDWIAAWNRRDIDHVVAGFAEHARFRSPLAERITGSAVVDGKAQIADYWRAALATHSELRFELVEVICDADAQTMAIHYVAHLNGTARRTCEVFTFENGVKVAGEAFYGAEEG